MPKKKTKKSAKKKQTKKPKIKEIKPEIIIPVEQVDELIDEISEKPADFEEPLEFISPAIISAQAPILESTSTTQEIPSLEERTEKTPLTSETEQENQDYFASEYEGFETEEVRLTRRQLGEAFKFLPEETTETRTTGLSEWHELEHADRTAGEHLQDYVSETTRLEAEKDRDKLPFQRKDKDYHPLKR